MEVLAGPGDPGESQPGLSACVVLWLATLSVQQGARRKTSQIKESHCFSVGFHGAWIHLKPICGVTVK